MSTDEQEPSVKVLLPSKVYDWLKVVVTIILPAIGAFYLGLAAIYGFPNSIGFNGTINLICALLGTILGFSSRSYNKSVGKNAKYDGVIDIDSTGEKTIVATGYSEDTLANLENKKEIVLRVNNIK